jgi:hypothetical protein
MEKNFGGSKISPIVVSSINVLPIEPELGLETQLCVWGTVIIVDVEDIL